MGAKDETLSKLLPKSRVPDQEKDEPAAPRYLALYNFGIGFAAALFLAFTLLPRFPQLEKGEIASRTVLAPYTMYVEYPGADQTFLSYKVNKGEVIAEAGHRISERAARIMNEIARREGIGNRGLAFLGMLLLIQLILYIFYLDIKRYKTALISDKPKIFLLAFLLLITVILSQFTEFILSLIADKLPIHAMTIHFSLPVSAGAMLVCLLFDFHLALGFSFMISILLGILFQEEMLLPVYYFLGSIVASFTVIHCKKRSALIRGGALTGVVNILAIICIDLYKGGLFARGLYDMTAGFLGALTVSMIVSVSLPFLESLFDIATDIKLLELLEPNQPLLKELVYRSPGTYHHSIVIGNLAEAAAEAIGENPLLARVGAYYHDVGKIRKPEYFIENQRIAENKHDRLMPSMSSLIIASHVKDGVEVARGRQMPSSVVDIIQQHHGTSLITYFYQKAKELHPLINIDERDYRYPGPRPKTKVAAIVMLADSVEAASRTLDDPTPERIQALTNSVITRIFLDDQLSKCDLTLKDLRDISRSFNLILSGIFHHRIDYPGMDFLGEKKRSEHRDKKQSEETKITDNGAREKSRETAAGHRTA